MLPDWLRPKRGSLPKRRASVLDAAMQQAKSAADKARKATAGIALLVGALSMLAAAAAYWAAMAGGRERDSNVWR